MDLKEAGLLVEESPISKILSCLRLLRAGMIKTNVERIKKRENRLLKLKVEERKSKVWIQCHKLELYIRNDLKFRS